VISLHWSRTTAIPSAPPRAIRYGDTQDDFIRTRRIRQPEGQRRAEDPDHAGCWKRKEGDAMTNEHDAAGVRERPIVYIQPVAVADLPEEAQGLETLYAIGSETGE
jgi:hypothetical protein